MSKPGYLPDENISESVLINQIRQIIKRCDQDLEKDTIRTRSSYDQIKAFHYDSIRKEIQKWNAA